MKRHWSCSLTIADDAALARAVESGVGAAKAGALVVFGVAPDCPHTGYGYIESEPGTGVDLKVRRFVEKPSLAAAEEYLDSGNFYWNAGMFLFKAATLLDLMQTHAPEIVAACRKALAGAAEDLTFLVLGESYAEAPSISLDYAVAEKAGNLRCVKLDTAWSDVGSSSAVWNVMDKDRAGNVARVEGEIILEDTRDSLAFSDRASVALVGVENVVVVATEDAVLVASKDHAESIKRVVYYLKGNGTALAFQHTRVYRPWGWYQGLDRGDRYQVKCIMVKPGGRLSLQSHRHRSEHWVVVGGTVEVTKGDEVKTARGERISLYPRRREASPRQSRQGPEDDIVRYDDIYGRSPTKT